MKCRSCLLVKRSILSSRPMSTKMTHSSVGILADQTPRESTDLAPERVSPANEDTRLTGPGARLSRRVSLILCLCGIAVIASVWRTNLVTLQGVHDFTGFFIGARLLGTPNLYDIPANLAMQKALTGYTLPNIIFVRPPFWAFVIKPFTFVDYHVALTVWKLMMFGALFAFSVSFSFVSTRYVALALCWSMPLANAFSTSNDAPLTLLFLGLSLAAWTKKKPVLSGIFLGLCLAKFHFLLFLPLLFLQRKYLRVMAGFCIPGLLAILVNFLVQPAWMSLYWKALNMPQENMNSAAGYMPNFYSAFFGTGHPGYGVALGILLATIGLWTVTRRMPFELAMPLCIVGGVLVAPHTNNFDSILTIPAFLMVAQYHPALRFPAILMLSPASGFLYIFGPAYWGSAAFVALSMWIVYRVGREQMTAPHIDGDNCGDKAYE